MEIKLILKEELNTILPLLSELNTSISIEVLEKRLGEMITNGYECAGIYSDNNLVGICGIWTLYKSYVGKHIEPDNVYVKREFQSCGIGEKLVNWLIEFAKRRDCEAIELNCYQGNKRGRDFWSKNSFEELAIHYRLKIDL